MHEKLYVASRKGLFILGRGKGKKPAWKVERTAFLGDPLSMVLKDPRDGALYAGLKLGHFGVKLHRSEDGGATWRELAAPSFPKEPETPESGNATATAEATGSTVETGTGEETKKGPSVSEIWALEAGGQDQAGRLWAGTIPGGLFLSEDRGESWNLVRSLWDMPERQQWFGGGADKPGIHSICIDPRDSKTLTLGVSCGGVWQSTDGGASWKNRAKGMFAVYMPPERREDPNIQDPHRMVQCAAAPEVFWSQHHNGVFRSTNGLESWHEIPNVQPSVFGFAVAVHPKDPKTAWFVPAVKDAKRIPVEGKVVVARTRDGGNNFDVLTRGLPQEHAYDLVFRHAMDIDQSGDRLAFGSTTGGLWITEDGGDSWMSPPARLPPIYCVRFG